MKTKNIIALSSVLLVVVPVLAWAATSSAQFTAETGSQIRAQFEDGKLKVTNTGTPVPAGKTESIDSENNALAQGNAQNGNLPQQGQDVLEAGGYSGLVPCGRRGEGALSQPCTACHAIVGGKRLLDYLTGIMVVVAITVIVAMGILYILSGVNESYKKAAKNGLTAVLFGLVFMLSAWLIVSTVLRFMANDNFVQGGGGFIGLMPGDGVYGLQCSTESDAGDAKLTPGGVQAGTGAYAPGALSCSSGKCAQKTDVVQAVKNNASGVDPNILMAIIDAGEGCNKSVSSDGFGSCGYSQALPAIRVKCGITGSSSASCTAVQNDVQLDVNCAAWLINNEAGRCGKDGTRINDVASCYNSGRPSNCQNTTNNYCSRVASYYNSCQ